MEKIWRSPFFASVRNCRRLSLLPQVYDRIARNGCVLDSEQQKLCKILDGLVENRGRGLYIHGNVGIGKTMLMDEYFTCVDNPQKMRVTFAQFMAEFHSRISQFQKRALLERGRSLHIDLSPEADSFLQVARQFSKEVRVLCIDEFHVTNVADAMALKKLFYELFSSGVQLIATSNIPPEQLYEGGINRQYFLPFIQNLREHCTIFHMKSVVDYRKRGKNIESISQRFFWPLNQQTYKQLRKQLSPLLGDALSALPTPFDLQLLRFSITRPHIIISKSPSNMLTRFPYSTTIQVSSYTKTNVPSANLAREIWVPFAHNGVCVFGFDQLCGNDSMTGTNEFETIVNHCQTLVLIGVPAITHDALSNIARLRRLVSLVDAVYDKKIQLVLVAEASFPQLLPQMGENINKKIKPLDGDWGGSLQLVGKGKFDISQESDIPVVSIAENAVAIELDKAIARTQSRLIELLFT